MFSQEIPEKILEYSEFETIEATRDLQSEYFRESTRYFDIIKAIKNGNLANVKFLIDLNCTRALKGVYNLIDIASIYNHIHIVEYLELKGYTLSFNYLLVRGLKAII